MDVEPVVREQTLKSVLTFIPKLSERTVNGELLKYLAKTANDEQPGIRTNTTICLGKIAKYLGNSSRSKVLIAAFTRSLRDPFVHARNAALMALAVTAEYFTEEDCAVRILPAVCPSLIDKEKLVRDQANKTIEVYLAKVRKAAANMPETALPSETAASNAGATPRMSTPQPDISSAASWAGWAISSFTNKLSAAAGDIQSASAASKSNGPLSTQPSKPATCPTTSPSTSSTANTHHRNLRFPTPSAPTSSPSAKESAFSPPPEEDFDGADAWGSMDDIYDDDNNDANNQQETDEDPWAAKSKPKPTSTKISATPFDDGGEPDFAGWLAAQAEKKKQGKVLPKGLAKSSSLAASSAGAKKPTTSIVSAKTTSMAGAKSKPVVAKKIDMKPKDESLDDDEGWGGW